MSLAWSFTGPCFSVKPVQPSFSGFTSSLDIVQPLFKDVLSSLGTQLELTQPFTMECVNIPDYFKHAIIQLLSKKPNFDPLLPSDYRPIFKLPFISKVLEKVVTTCTGPGQQ